LFSGGVSEGRLDLTRFVALTATEPARLYGLYPRKGTIAMAAMLISFSGTRSAR